MVDENEVDADEVAFLSLVSVVDRSSHREDLGKQTENN